jgi:pimeloyl-ACP methyl ester carboxylesterase
MCAAGFLQQFAGVCRPDVPEKNMSSVIEQLSGGRIPTRVLCCGHSLGGALATLGMTYTAALNDVSVLVCYGSLACLLLQDRPLPAS